MGQIPEGSFTDILDGETTDFFSYNGTKGTIEVWGDFGSGTLDLQYSVGGEVWVIDPNFALTEPNIRFVHREVPLGTKFRFVASGGIVSVNTFFVQGEGK